MPTKTTLAMINFNILAPLIVLFTLHKVNKHRFNLFQTIEEN
jgi:hypothetical protein